jgi:4-amino-4-deoxy-L-arabinose transferase-like glycosyltransferase
MVIWLAFVLRVYLLGAQNFWWDEALAIWAVRKGFVPMTLWTATDVHPPLFFWLLYALTRVAGETEFAARMTSLLYGVMTVPLAYQLGRKLFNPIVGWGAAILLAASRFHVWWSQELRMYALAALWGAASLYFFVSWWQERRSPAAWKRLIPYVLTSVAALYTVYIALLVLIVQNVFVLLATKSSERRSAWLQWATAQISVFLLLLPWLLLALPRMQSWSTATPFSFSAFVRLYATLLSLGISTNIERYTWLIWPFGLICLVGLWMGWREANLPVGGAKARSTIGALLHWQPLLLLLLCLALPLIGVYLLAMPRALFYSPRIEARYLLPFALAFYLLLAWSLWQLWRRWRAAAIVGVLYVVLVFGWSLPQHYQGRYLRDEGQSMVSTVLAYAQEGDAVCLISGNRYPLWDYYYNNTLKAGWRPPLYLLPAHAELITAENVEREFAPLLEKHPRLWLVLLGAQLQDPEGRAKSWLDGRLNLLVSSGFGADSVHLYAKSASAPSLSESAHPEYILDMDIIGAGWLTGYDLSTGELRLGDEVRMALYWRDALGGVITVNLEDAQGRVLENRRVELTKTAGRAQLAFPVYARTPAGRYHFRIAEDGLGRAFGEVRVSQTTPLPTARQVASPLSLYLGEQVQLVGFDLRAQGRRTSSVRPGDTLQLTLYWRSEEKIDERFTVFTHLIGQAYNPATNGPLWAQHDSEPLDGGLPTTQWFLGQIIVDEHLLNIDGNAPAGEYEIEVGLYRTETQARLPVRDAQGLPLGDRVLLGRWRVEANH